MSNSVRYTAAKAREVENTRLVWLDGELRHAAALDLDTYLAERSVDDTVNYCAEDRDEWAAGHAALVARVAELPAGDEAHAHEFALRKATPAALRARRDGEVNRGGWLVGPCACGRVCA